MKIRDALILVLDRVERGLILDDPGDDRPHLQGQNYMGHWCYATIKGAERWTLRGAISNVTQGNYALEHRVMKYVVKEIIFLHGVKYNSLHEWKQLESSIIKFSRNVDNKNTVVNMLKSAIKNTL